MKDIKYVRINEELIHVFDYVRYVYDNEIGDCFFHLDLIVTEVVIIKYVFDQEVKVSLVYNNGEEHTFTMLVQGVTEVGNAEIPILELCVKIDDPEKFQELKIVKWDTPLEEYSLGNNITIEEIRRIEMPNREVQFEATLPIDLEEWVYSNRHKISTILTEALTDYKNKKI
ncbi:hypothetical protein QFZ31_005756 [Neobacillus niacini]|uniref:hypothetical protein n=1 Tax=Neobacillus driksii TaxID=3035913 RepID=UPI0027834385|nr:hypothetical protein [Neobacillus niacini]MDQ0975878.1 hypothetical protein [Neobacillus niacini]